MLKKCLRFVLLAALLVPLGARAETDTLTVAEGTTTSGYIPIYGYWSDANQHNQIIYPASMLDTMIGMNITGLNFDITGAFSCTNATVSLAIVPDSVCTTSFVSASLVQVWSGPVNGTLEMEFTNAFAYTGGNLLVDIVTTSGSYGNSTAHGINRTGASVYSYNTNTSVQNFLPQATFIYSDESFCNAPMNLTFDANTNNSLTFHWTPGSTETSWEVMVGDSIITNVSTTTITVDNLNASSRYAVAVRGICGADDTSSWCGAVTMLTNCAAITNLPWSAGFEGETDSIPLCWSRPAALTYADYNGGAYRSPYVYNSTYSSHDGLKSLYFTAYNYYGLIHDSAVVASPYIAHNPSDLHVSFWFYPSSFYEGNIFQAGIMTDANDTSTFVPMLTIDVNALGDNYGYQQFEFYTSSLTGFSDEDSACVAFRSMIGDAQSMYVYLDDVVIDAMGTCLPPVLNSGHVDSLSYESVQLSWQPATEETTDFDVLLVNLNTGESTHYAATDTTILINGLDPYTMYEAYVATVCDGTDTTNYIYIDFFQTHYRCYNVVNAEVVALTANAAALSWDFTGTGIAPASVELVLTDLSDSTALPIEVSVVDATTYTFSGLTENHMYVVSFVTLCGSDGDTSSTEVFVTFMPHMPPCAEVTGTGVNQNVPFYSLYNNGFSESLYDAALIEGVDTITGITLEVANPLNRDNIFDIYMGYTSLSNLTGSSAYVPVSELTHVVSDYSLNTGVSGVTDIIPFDTVFVTQPTGDSLNLIIAFYNHTGSWTSGLSWATHTSPIGTSCYLYTDSPVDVTNPWGTPYTTDQAPNIQFYGTCGGGDCLAPSVTVSAVDTTSATLTWLPGGSESSWTVQYRIEGTTAWTTAGTALTQPYTVSGLNPGTNYQFRMGSDCGDTTVFSTATTGATLCGRVPAPFTIAPNGENNCWTYGGSGYYSSYSNYYYIYSGGYIITPALADSINTLQLKLRGYGAKYYVGACNGTNTNVTWIDTVEFTTDDYSYEVRKSYLNNYDGDYDHIIVRASNDYTYISHITVEPLDDCMPVQNLQLDSVTTTDAWLSWTSEGTNFNVQYMAESDSLGTWNSVNVTTNSAHLTGLNSNDRYQIKVFNVCSATSVSDSATLRIATGCTNYTVPFLEELDHGELPVCWNTIAYGNTNNGTTWETSANYGYYDYIYSYADYSGNIADDWLMTPMIQLPTNADYYQVILTIGGGPSTYTSGSTGGYEVYVSTTGNSDTSSYTRIYVDTTISTYNSSLYGYVMSDVHLPLAAYAGQAVSIAIRNISTNQGVIYLDDVVVREAVNPVYYLTGDPTVFLGDTAHYVANYVEGALEGITYSWTSTMAAAGHATLIGANTDSLTVIYTAEGVDTLTFIATNSYGADTNRGRVYIYDCSPVTTFPFYESFESPTAPAGCWSLIYADGDPSINPMLHIEAGDDGYLTTVADGDRVFRFSSYSSSTDYNQFLISRELDGTNLVLSFDYLKGSYASTTVDNIRVGYSSTNRDTNSFTWGEWITGISTDTWATFTDSLPEGTKYVAIQYWGSYAYYVYIDNFIITGTSALCEAPVDLTVTDTAETSVSIAWSGETSSYEVAYVEGDYAAFEDATLVTETVTDSAYTFNDLNAETQYTFGVRAVCAAGRTSEWVTVTVTTDIHPCYAPTALTYSDVTYTSATLGWTAGEEGQDAWEIHVTGGSYDQTFSTTTNPYTVTGLTNATTYTFEVRANCGNDRYSDWSDAEEFTTSTCESVIGAHAMNVTANSASIHWTAPAGATNFELEYGMSGFNRGQGTTVTANTNSYVINGLSANMAYDVYVRTMCEEGVYSSWSSKVEFTTADGEGIDDVNAAAISLYPNPASSTVTLTGIEGMATVTVVDMNGRVSGEWKVVDGKLTIDVTEMAQGAYFVRIVGEQVNAIRKLIVR